MILKYVEERHHYIFEDLNHEKRLNIKDSQLENLKAYLNRVSLQSLSLSRGHPSHMEQDLEEKNLV
ncbi:hypothetical protein N7508_003084 [Penicillium antarcticum]|uniref:uncharacterized protein n=1 Tax=Penicillium antarcticum TaxID=416450 RepID=UPI00239916DA|nr:uncharacterized protein N7508_003084 [Penicillium antarcticum]KAJ5312254.1 hypothetical protein N7508_003084 [Penicillium antarcticum]